MTPLPLLTRELLAETNRSAAPAGDHFRLLFFERRDNVGINDSWAGLMDTYILVIVLETLGDSEYTLRYIGKIFSIPFPPRAFIFPKAKELSGLQCLDDRDRLGAPAVEGNKPWIELANGSIWGHFYLKLELLRLGEIIWFLDSLIQANCAPKHLDQSNRPWGFQQRFPNPLPLEEQIKRIKATPTLEELLGSGLPGTGDLSPGLEMTENIDGSVYVEKNMASGWIVTTSERRSRHVVEERVLAPAGCPIWRRPESNPDSKAKSLEIYQIYSLSPTGLDLLEYEDKDYVRPPS
ncbi:hypothetical protein Q9233_013100 [Columba guinea]|nr:hypothetical protein Q9233_013100 [Columba guinea]